MAGGRSRVLAWVVPIAAEMAALARSVVLARLIGADELGQAMMLALVLRLTEMVSDVGVERLLAQAHDGDDPRLQAQLQAAVLLRGLAMAGAMCLLAAPLSWLFADGPTPLGYAAMGLVPLARAFLHLDYRRRERHFSYRSLAIVELSATAMMLIGATLAALVIQDHRAMIVAVLAHALTQVALSHLVAERRYALDFDRAGLLRTWSFGAPLILNAALMYLTLQADRLIVAGAYGWSDVAIYGIALQLATLPAQIVGRAAHSLLAPRFRLAIERGTLHDEARRALWLHLGLSILFLVGYVGLVRPATGLVYGDEFIPTLALVIGLGLAGALRIMRTPISQLAVSSGRTGDPARANLWRAFSLGPALAAAFLGAPLAAIGMAAACGEVLGLIRGWVLLVKAGAITRPDTRQEGLG